MAFRSLYSAPPEILLRTCLRRSLDRFAGCGKIEKDYLSFFSTTRRLELGPIGEWMLVECAGDSRTVPRNADQFGAPYMPCR